MHKFSNATLVTDDDRIVVDDVDLYDFAPTLLDLLEIDVDADFDGRSLVRA
jgi:arylsulfatase A-like enzyme